MRLAISTANPVLFYSLRIFIGPHGGDVAKYDYVTTAFRHNDNGVPGVATDPVEGELTSFTFCVPHGAARRTGRNTSRDVRKQPESRRRVAGGGCLRELAAHGFPEYADDSGSCGWDTGAHRDVPCGLCQGKAI